MPSAVCGVCGLPSPRDAVCGACLSERPHFDTIAAAFVYAFPIDAVVQRLKYRGDLALAPLLGKALAQRVTERPDVMVPVPLSDARIRERGFNQAIEIARVVESTAGLALRPEVCRRVSDRPPQAGLPWAERAKNVRGAFACDVDMTGLHVAVIDDVMTTGATLNEFARVLKLAGAARVSGWVAARTLRD